MKSYKTIIKEIDKKSKIYWEKMQEILDLKLIEKKQEDLTINDITKIKFTDNLNAQINILKWIID